MRFQDFSDNELQILADSLEVYGNRLLLGEINREIIARKEKGNKASGDYGRGNKWCGNSGM